MNLTLVILLSAAAGFVLGLAAAYLIQARRRSEELKAQFGGEYDRTVRETGNRVRAESALQERRERVRGLHLRPLTEEERSSFETKWNRVQAHFVDDPGSALSEADLLIGDIMRTVGYPVSDLEQRINDISVEHPHVVEHYREAHSIAIRNVEHRATTEDLRHAMLHYRKLFDELVGEPAGVLTERNKRYV